MTDSGVMRAAKRAAAVVATWSASKQAYAARVMAERIATPAEGSGKE